ncbi:MAG: phage portal protein [Sulfitobacter sp.]
MFWPFKRDKAETRSSGTGYTSQIMTAREAYFTGQSGLAELTGTVQSCVSLWEGGLSLADVEDTELLTSGILSLAGRALGLRGEAVFLIRDDGLVPCSDWDLSTKFSRPNAYRVGIPEIGGGKSLTVLADEVLHLRVGCEVNMPYVGVPPLRRSSITAGLLQVMESALSEIYENAPLGSSVVPFPETADTDLDALARGFRGYRGRVQVRESVNVQAAGGPAPQQDWKPNDLTPDLSKAMTRETWAAARASIEMAFGVLPGLSNIATTGPMVREAQRHLAQWALMPIATMIGEEATVS